MKNLRKKFFISLLLTSILVLFLFNNVYASEIEDLQAQIKKQQEQIKQLEAQKKIYQAKIDQKRKDAVTLKNQINILDNQIIKTKTEIQEKEVKIKESGLQIRNIQIKIQDQRQQITIRKHQLTQLLKLINQYDRKSNLEIIFLNGSVSEFLNQVKYVENLQSSLQDNLDKIKLIQSGLEVQEKDLRDKRQELTDLQNELFDQKNQLSTEKKGKSNLLTETRGAEWKFQSLLAAAIKEQQAAEQDIAYTEKLIRNKMTAQKNQEMAEKLAQLDAGEGGGQMLFSWPVPQDTITTAFHDPDYPFRKWLGEHPAIDIRASQGTSIRATAAGYVAKAKDAGMGYSYIMLIHNNGFATVYGHVSAIYVKEDTYVRRGDVIGRSGGLPGTPGAGRFSTGPHLHYEVRLNGLPVNPIDYLI